MLCIAVLAIYAPILFEFSEKIGFLRLLPVWLCLFVGFVVAQEWIEDRIAGKRSASPEVHNSNFPVPSVRASGWRDILIASEASVSEAFKAAKGRRNGIIGVVHEDGNELVLRWNRKGWDIALVPRGERERRIAVNNNDKYYGNVIIVSGWFDVFFKRLPKGTFDLDTAQGVVRSFLGRGEMPHNVAWSTIKYL